ncbi:MAG: MOSC domain-containing protein [Pirellulales bacterium]
MIQAAPTTTCGTHTQSGKVVAVCVSAGGIPKRTLAAAQVTASGLTGDGHAHAKHIRSERALSLFDMEILAQLRREGFALYPGAIGENLTVVGLNVQLLPSGTLLEIGNVVIRLEEPRKPCYVLDTIHPCLKDVIVGRCGYMASVVQEGRIEAGMDVVELNAGATRVAALQQAGNH